MKSEKKSGKEIKIKDKFLNKTVRKKIKRYVYVIVIGFLYIITMFLIAQLIIDLIDK